MTDKAMKALKRLKNEFDDYLDNEAYYATREMLRPKVQADYNLVLAALEENKALKAENKKLKRLADCYKNTRDLEGKMADKYETKLEAQLAERDKLLNALERANKIMAKQIEDLAIPETKGTR